MIISGNWPNSLISFSLPTISVSLTVTFPPSLNFSLAAVVFLNEWTVCFPFPSPIICPEAGWKIFSHLEISAEVCDSLV